VRKHWLAIAALSSALGCAGSGSTATNSGLTQAAPAASTSNPWAQPTGVGSQLTAPAPTNEEPSWWTRVTAGFTNPFVRSPEEKLRAEAERRAEVARRNDPLSLSNAPGEPTPAVLVSMAQLSDHAGRTDQARDLYRKALTAEENNLDALLGLGRLEDREGNFDEALRLYHQAAAAHPHSATALNDLALCYARKGELPRSLSLLDRTAQMSPQNPLYRNNIAKVLVKMNLLEDALAHQSAVYPPAVAHYNLGVLLQEQGRLDEAESFFRTAVAADPQFEQARLLLTQLEYGKQQAQATIATEITRTAALPTAAAPAAAYAGYALPTGLSGTPAPPSMGFNAANQPQAPPVVMTDESVLPTPVDNSTPRRYGPQPTTLPPVE
jgi:tetratricopeptide (TPR) repeat protein